MKELYIVTNTWAGGLYTCFDSSSKKDPNFLTRMSKMKKIMSGTTQNRIE